MPRNVRNFWIDLWIDGRETDIGVGPKHADGGFAMTIRIREDGEISPDLIDIVGRADGDKLTLDITLYGERHRIMEKRR